MRNTPSRLSETDTAGHMTSLNENASLATKQNNSVTVSSPGKTQEVYINICSSTLKLWLGLKQVLLLFVFCCVFMLVILASIFQAGFFFQYLYYV